jgi:SecD/SecF fusion protein
LERFFQRLQDRLGVTAGRLVICLVPFIISLVVIGVALSHYLTGDPGLTFRMGVDLSGGTTLVYELDQSRNQGGMGRNEDLNARLEELTTALKRRIDPADLYNITVRPIPGDPPRIEIVLPFGGRNQEQARLKRWEELVEQVGLMIPQEARKDLASIALDETARLEQVAAGFAKDPDAVKAKVAAYRAATGGKVGLSENDIERIKSRITQQGLLQFAILARADDDAEAFEAAKAYLSSLKTNAEAQARENGKLPGQAPEPPRRMGNTAGQDPGLFTVRSGSAANRHRYRWVELGKAMLYGRTDGGVTTGLQLNNAARDSANWKLADSTRPCELEGMLVYKRDIKPELRQTPYLGKKDVEDQKQAEYWVLVREPEEGKAVDGGSLTAVYRTMGGRGEPAVGFSLDGEGARKFYDLTSRNVRSRLSIILDGQIHSAPTLQSGISDSGQITGDFTQAELDDLIRILRAGALPATLSNRPASEANMGATLGAETILRGAYAIIGAFIAVLAFMVYYYRFAGMVACIALFANLTLTVAFMLLVQATFTLPGLAGLVLTLGMAVDANVLIYERLREERQNGASLVVAIRNGYDRALPTIIDTHLSSIFTAIVLYVVGNDQLKGFGISLTAGLIISLFTSLYLTRTMFNMWLHMSRPTELNMLHLFRNPRINFMRIRWAMFYITLFLTVAGGALFLARGKQGLDIDFNGGTAYTGALKTPRDMAWIVDKFNSSSLPDRKIEQIFIAGSSEGAASKYFTVRTSEISTEKVASEVARVLGDDLEKNSLASFQVGEKGKAASSASTVQFSFSTEATLDQVSRVVKDSLQARAKKGNQIPSSALSSARVDPVGKSTAGRHSDFQLVLLESVPTTELAAVFEDVKARYAANPQPERLDNFNASMAGATQGKAMGAIVASWLAIVLYLWLRFGNWTFGLAALLCLVHDLFFTLGAIAICHYLVGIPGLSAIFQIQDFKIDLPAVAALLTLVGYSVNDTIVVFDRIREVRGRNPLLTEEMINDSVNQTLSRTVLASLTTWLVVVVLYFSGAEGIHLFAFVMVIGVIVGTYSSIYIASPLLLMFGEGRAVTEEATRQIVVAEDAAT